jgi:hypothetical protein
MATFRNTTTSTLSLGPLQLAPNATVVDTEHDATVLENIQYFYESDKLTLVSGTPDFTSVTAADSGVIQYTTVQWTSLDPVLGANIIGVDTTLGTIKIGNGTQHYSALRSIGGGGGKGTDIVSAATIDLGASTGQQVDITGNTTITGMGTAAAGTTRFVRFTGALILTYNATSLILPASRNILTTAGDRATFISLGSGNWYCHEYLKASGIAVGTVDEQIIAVSGNMSNVQSYGSVINNYGQAADVIITLPTCAKGMNFIFLAGTTVAKYYRFTPAAGDSIYLDGTTTGDAKYVALATITKGDSIQFVAYQTGASAYDWYAVSAIGNWSAEA